MNNDTVSTSRKALIINEDERLYGTFAEIGAGQEVARYFFQAGHASKTVAKTMSAYDMTFSDAIYGKASRYVSRDRLVNMLNHEYSLLSDRLETKGRSFFAFANTVATSSHKEDSSSNAWIGVRFQHRENGPVNEVLVHVHLLDRLRLQQQEVLGILGVNLIYSAAYLTDSEDQFIGALLDNVSIDRAQVDFIHFKGEDLKNLSIQRAGLQLLANKMSHSLIFAPNGEVLQSTDHLYGKSVVILRGTYAPITNTNLDILECAEKEAKKFDRADSKSCSILEFTMKNLDDPNKQPYDEYMNRIQTINACGHSVMVTVYPLFYQIKKYIRQCTKEQINIVIGYSLLEQIFNESFYEGATGGILNAFGKLFDENSRLLVFPFKESDTCSTAKTFQPEEHLKSLYAYLSENNFLNDILNCDDIDTSTLSSAVREKLQNQDSSWKNDVPPEVRKLIEEQKLFGFK